MSTQRYVVITLDDAKRIARWLRGAPLDKEPIATRCDAWRSGPLWCSLPAGHDGEHDYSDKGDAIVCASAIRIADRMAAETGADIEEIAGELKRLDVCAACNIEGQTASCLSLHARKLGRRIARLLERARGERGEPSR